MRKQLKKLSLSRETIKKLETGQILGGVEGVEVVTEDTNDRRCEPSIVSCHAGC